MVSLLCRNDDKSMREGFVVSVNVERRPFLLFFTKNARGRYMPSMYCFSTAPTAISEASVIMLVGATGSGYASKQALARASLMALNADLVASVQSSV